MDQKIRVIVGDSSFENRELLAASIASQQDMEVVGYAGNGEEALGQILRLKPDIAVLEVLLPVKDGLGVLEGLQEAGYKGTACIMVSTMDSDAIINKSLDLGAKYYLIKPFQETILMRRIRQVYEAEAEHRMLRAEFPQEPILPKLPPQNSKELRVSRLLNRLGITASIKGYHYVRTAILMALEDPEVLVGITKGLYPDIAKKYKTSASKVERAIRHAIESAWKRGAGELYNELIGYHPGSKPTNGQFIAAMAEHIRMYPDENTL